MWTPPARSDEARAIYKAAEEDRKANPARYGLEVLEARLNLSTYVINNLYGPTDSLLSALAANYASGGGNTIQFDNNVFKTHQTIQLYDYYNDFSIDGPVTIIVEPPARAPAT